MNLAPKTLSSGIENYAAPRARVKEIFVLGQQKIDCAKVLTYWDIARAINEHILCHKERADYGTGFFLKLSEDVGVNESVLRRLARFHAQFPIQAHGPESYSWLNWSHYRFLITIKDEKLRYEFAECANRMKWKALDLALKIRREIHSVDSDAPVDSETRPLKPKCGKPGTYRVIRRETVQAGGSDLLIDLGFMIYRNAEVSGSRPDLKEDDIIEWRPNDEGWDKCVRSKDCTAADLFTYRAFVERVVDSDTLRVKIELGFDTWTRQYLRLQGIDCPEIETRKGRVTKDFFERILAKTKCIVIQTARSDKYDRYLADIFYGPDNANYLNQLLLDHGHAVRVKE